MLSNTGEERKKMLDDLSEYAHGFALIRSCRPLLNVCVWVFFLDEVGSVVKIVHPFVE